MTGRLSGRSRRDAGGTGEARRPKPIGTPQGPHERAVDGWRPSPPGARDEPSTGVAGPLGRDGPDGDVGPPGRLTLSDAAAALHLPLSAQAESRLQTYLNLLQRWNRVYNLTAVRDGDDMLRQHLFDCLAVVPALNAHLASTSAGEAEPAATAGPALGPDASPAGRPRRILDVGSGGGLPGVVLAIVRPEWQVHCVDAVAKKAAFIQQAAAELAQPNLRASHARVESLRADRPADGYHLITSRAFSSLRLFTDLTGHLLAEGGSWVAMKGRVPDQEVAELPSNVEVFHVEHLRVPGLDAQRCLVWMRPKSVAQ